MSILDSSIMQVPVSGQLTLPNQIQKKRERLRALRLANERVLKDVEAVASQLVQVKARHVRELQTAKTDLATAKTALVYTREVLEKKLECSEALNHFIDKVGLSIGYGETAPGVIEKSLHFSGLWNHDEDCIIYFSDFKLPNFKVTSSTPRLRHFEDLATEVNESKNLLFLIFKAREHFLQFISKCSTDTESTTFSIKLNN